MANALSSSFDEWIPSLLNELQSNDADMSDFVQYLMGIVTSDSETDEEKQIAIAELLADLDLKVQIKSFKENKTVFYFFSIIIISINSANKFSIAGINHKMLQLILQILLTIE
jgi:hypothetical protein